MKRKSINILFALFLAIIVFTSCTTSDDESEYKVMLGVVDTVTISNMAFHPSELSVNKGDTVVWINEDIVPHDVAAFPGNEWSSDTLSMGQTWLKVIEKEFEYFCNIHPIMRGKIDLKK